MSIEIIGHAIVGADGHIADRNHLMPEALRNEADWRRFQAELDRAAIVVLGRLGHEAHPNPGRRRLVVTSRVISLVADPDDPLASFWNPAGLGFDVAMERLDIDSGIAAITGGTRVFDLFLPRFTRFDLVEVAAVSIPGGVPCFSAGPPAEMLAGAGLRPAEREALDAEAVLTVWR